MLATGAGRLVGQDGGTISPVGLVGQDGGTVARLIMGNAEPDATPVVTARAGELFSDAGVTLISDNGLGLVSDNGLGLISDNGLGLISDNGLGLVGGAGTPFVTRGRYALTQAPASPNVAAGGMRVSVLSLADGQAVPLGIDAAGQPVLAVYTDAAGGYTAYLPAALVGNVVVVARPPDRQDPRLELGRLAAATDARDLAVDDPEALATAYFRTMMVAQIDGLVAQDAPGSLFPARFSAQIPEPLRARAEEVVARLRAAYTAAGLQTLSPADRRFAVQRAVDALCARVDFAAVPIDTTNTAYKGPGGPAMPALAKLVQAIVAAARTKLNADPAFFDKRPYLLDENAARKAQGRPEVRILRPTDVATFMVTAYLSANDQDDQERGQPLWDDLGLGADARLQLRGVVFGLYMAVGLPLLADEVAGQPLALKVVSGGEGGDKSLLQFKQEFRLMTRLRHPNCCAVHDYGETEDGQPYFTMEVVPGRGLDELVARGETRDPATFKAIFAQLLLGLGYVHQQGFVHCDLKPANVRVGWVGGQLHVKLMDFGLMD